MNQPVQNHDVLSMDEALADKPDLLAQLKRVMG